MARPPMPTSIDRGDKRRTGRLSFLFIFLTTMSVLSCTKDQSGHSTLTNAQRYELSRSCAESADKFSSSRQHDTDDPMLHTSHFNGELYRCFVKASSRWDTQQPFKSHTFEVVSDAIEGTEIQTLETMTWFDAAALHDKNGKPHITFRVNREDNEHVFTENTPEIVAFRALMSK
jgi:hypothetical protein